MPRTPSTIPGRCTLCARALTALVFCAVASTTNDALAQASLDQEFAEGFALQPLEPAPASDHFFAVPDAHTRRSSAFHAYILGNYTYKPALIRRDNVTGERRELVRKQLYVNLDASYAATERVLINVDMPFAASQTGEGPAAPNGSKLGDLRFGARGSLTDPESRVFAFSLGADVWFPTGSPQDLTGDEGLRFRPQALLGGQTGLFVYSANAGFMLRKQVDAGSTNIGNAVTFGAAAGLSVLDDHLLVGPELYGAKVVADSQAPGATPETLSLSGLLGVNYRIGDVVLGGGVGPALSDAVGVAPRAVFRLAYTPQTKHDTLMDEPIDDADRDGDGVSDQNDSCPDEAGPIRPGDAGSGCPEEEQPAAPESAPGVPDDDGDGVNNADDACPDEHGTRSDDPKENGCPRPSGPVDSDGDGVPDASDKCPEQPGEASAEGCPAAAEATPEPDETAPHPDGTGPAVTYAGFTSLPDGRSLITVHVQSEVAVTLSKKPGRVVFTLEGARITVNNNKNPLDVEHFTTVIRRARAVPAGNAVKIIIELRQPAEPTHRVVKRPDGTAAVLIEFPKVASSPTP